MNKINPKFSLRGNPATGVEERRETTRGELAARFLCLFGCVVVIALLYVVFGNPSPEKIDLMKWIITALIGLIGAVFGFYFGQK